MNLLNNILCSSTAAALLAAIFAGGCANRQKSAGELMIKPDNSAADNKAIASAPKDDMGTLTPAANAAPPTVVTPANPTTITPATPAVSSAGATNDRLAAAVKSDLAAPTDFDEATRLRGWNNTTSVYANGNVVAGPTYRILPPQPRTTAQRDVAMNDFSAPLYAVPQILLTPIWILFTPPLTEASYHGDQFPPSYTVDDPKPFYTTEKVPGMYQVGRK